MNRIILHEWKSGLVLKRLILGFLWIFCLLTGIYNCIAGVYEIVITGEIKQLFTVAIGLLFCLIAYGTRHEAYRKICLTYQCFPNLNRMLPVTDQKNLLPDSEVFHPIEALLPCHRKYTKWDRMESAHWLRIKGYYISRELLVGVGIQNTKGNLKPYRKSTYLHFTYVNGESFEIRLEDALDKEERQNYRRYFAEHCGTTSYLSSRKLLDSINKTYCIYRDDYAQRNGYSTDEESIVAITKGGSELKEHIKTKYRHYWEKEESRC